MKRYISTIVLFAIAVSLLFFSCDISVSAGADGSDTQKRLLPLEELPTELEAFASAHEQQLHDYFYEYALRFNRVNSLVNSVLFADFHQTDFQKIRELSAAAEAELEAFSEFCRDMEDYGENELAPAIEQIRETVDPRVYTISSRAVDGDTWHARRLVEMMLDPEYGTIYSPADIANRTGVKMQHILFLMGQVSRSLADDIDILDVEEKDAQIQYCETVRDTAGAVNSTLALATPLGAFGTGAAGVTTSAAGAVGWLAKAKSAYTVAENASAVITFTGNVVNLAVDEKDQPPAFKAVGEVNGYIGLAFGGIGGFTGASGGEKAVALIGTATDATTKFFTVTDEGIEISDTPQLTGTAESSESQQWESVLPAGKYRIPSVDPSEWELPEVEWLGDEYWQEVYEGTAELAGATYDEYRAKFDLFAADWDTQKNTENTETAQTDGERTLPELFEMPGTGDLPDHGEVQILPVAGNFEVTIQASGAGGFAPYEITCTAIPNQRFLPEGLKLHWDFGDSQRLTQIISDATTEHSVTHSYASEGVYTLSLTAEDVRGYQAEDTLELQIGGSLQEILDAAKGTASIIHVPAGTYLPPSSGYIKVWEGLTLWGADKENTIIEGTVELYPDTHVEGFTFTGGRYGGIKEAGDSTVFSERTDYDIEIIGNIFNLVYDAIWLYPKDDMVYTGEISHNEVRKADSFLLSGPFSGLITDNDITGASAEASITISGGLTDSLFARNRIIASGGIEIYGDIDNTLIEENTFSGLDRSGFVVFEIGNLIGGSVMQNNSFTESAAYGSHVASISSDSVIKENSFTDNTSGFFSISGRGLFNIGTVEGLVEKNTFTGNSYTNFSGALFQITAMADSGIVKDNVLSDNTIKNDSGYGMAVLAGGLAGTFKTNTITGNAAHGFYSRYAGGTISGNTMTGNDGIGAIIAYDYYTTLQPSTLIKDSNTISGNGSGIDHEQNPHYDLSTPWDDDLIPAKE